MGAKLPAHRMALKPRLSDFLPHDFHIALVTKNTLNNQIERPVKCGDPVIAQVLALLLGNQAFAAVSPLSEKCVALDGKA